VVTSIGDLALGIDIGGTKTAIALVHRHRGLLASATLPTDAAMGFNNAVTRFGDSIDALLRQAQCNPQTLAGIGIGCAGPVDPSRGLINNPYTLEGWIHADIVTPLQQRFSVPVRLENDADAAACGEYHSGAGRGAHSLVMLTLGTGIGGAVIIDHHIYRGAQGEHPELGHLLVADEGPPCYCGIRGCFESTASGTAIAACGKQYGFSDAPDVFRAANAGHPDATMIVDRAVAACARAAWTLCHTFLPDRLILGGGIMDDHFERFAHAIRHRIAPATQFTPGNVSVIPAALGNQAGMIGAAAMMLGADLGSDLKY
jgi:glucokinase